MLNYFEQMRRQALLVFRRSFKPTVNGKFIQNALQLPDVGDCYNCLLSYGFSPDADTCNFPVATREEERIWTVSIKKFRQQNLPILDLKAQFGPTRLKKDYVLHGLNLTTDEKFMEQLKQQQEQAEARKREEQLK